MLDWFNNFLTLFSEIIVMFFELPFYGNISFGYIVIAILLLVTFLHIFFTRIK